jgi:hypothetical protein
MNKCPKLKKITFIGEISNNERFSFEQKKTLQIMCIMFPSKSKVKMIAEGGILSSFLLMQ